jgi:hypothetical protein
MIIFFYVFCSLLIFAASDTLETSSETLENQNFKYNSFKARAVLLRIALTMIFVFIFVGFQAFSKKTQVILFRVNIPVIIRREMSISVPYSSLRQHKFKLFLYAGLSGVYCTIVPLWYYYLACSFLGVLIRRFQVQVILKFLTGKALVLYFFYMLVAMIILIAIQVGILKNYYHNRCDIGHLILYYTLPVIILISHL